MKRTASPRARLRAVLYARVSSEEQVQGYSLDAQDRAARAYCDAHGWDLVAVYRDEGKSARTDDLAIRPEFARMLADAEAGLFDVVISHKLDRFARNRRVAFDAFHRLGQARVGFVSIAESMDFSTPAGQLMLTMLVGLAQFYSDNLSFETKKGKAERKAQGVYNGILPFGIKKNSKGVLVPHPENYPGLVLAFRLAAEGKSDRDVAEALNAAGYRTTGNRGANLFTKDTVRRILLNRFYLGELPDGEGGWLPGAHEPVLDDELFERARQTREANATNAAKVRRNARRYSLSGLAVCGGCGGRLHFNTAPNGKGRAYCYQIQQRGGCGQRSVFLDGIEEQLRTYLATFALTQETVDEVVRLYQSATTQQDDAARRGRELTAKLERTKEMYSWGDLTREAYVAQRDHIERELALLKGTTDYASSVAQAAALLRDLPAAWDRATAEQRNDLARLVFQSVEIKEDRVVAVLPTPEFAPFFNLVEETETGRLVLSAPDRQDVLSGGSDGIRTRDLSLDRAAC